ncbi:hypothetical protein [Streptomyces sp. NPDC047009]|uniref:hypothetical protein n=1 Tax=Streptomyces sp. NPDC047009 TaxID=3154496 RepID=UPI0033CFE3C0
MADLDELRRQVALGCRVLAATDTTTPLLGHVSVRLVDRHMLVRCRRPQELRAAVHRDRRS